MLLRLAVGVEVMLRKNLDVPDGLVNGARGVVQHIDLHPGGEIDKVWVSFEKGGRQHVANGTPDLQRCHPTHHRPIQRQGW